MKRVLTRIDGAADNGKSSKKKSIERINGNAALIMSLNWATTQESQESIYDKRMSGFTII
ncbi:MAG: hypothetical protein WEB58_17285 [Planctomycetaceae bacterium]